MRGTILALLLPIGWLILGSPADDVAGWVWGDKPAPWESVDAFYYPDRLDLSIHREYRAVGGLNECRAWVAAIARAMEDPRLARGDYECGIGFIRNVGDLKMYRVTAR